MPPLIRKLCSFYAVVCRLKSYKILNHGRALNNRYKSVSKLYQVLKMTALDLLGETVSWLWAYERRGRDL